MANQRVNEYVLTLCDFHVPYQDKRAINAALKFAKHIQPKILILHEVVDFYALSRFDKDQYRKENLQYELDEAFDLLKRIRITMPKTKIVMVESNHDIRLRRYLRSKSPELACLRCLTYDKLLRLDELDIDYRKDYQYRSVLFKHGSIIRNESCYTAKSEYSREGMSGASGHTHRLGLYFKTLRGGKYTWMECGCLCDPAKAEYIEGTADWQQGCGLFIFKSGSNRFDPKPIPIIDYNILWGEHEFCA